MAFYRIYIKNPEFNTSYKIKWMHTSADAGKTRLMFYYVELLHQFIKRGTGNAQFFRSE